MNVFLLSWICGLVHAEPCEPQHRNEYSNFNNKLHDILCRTSAWIKKWSCGRVTGLHVARPSSNPNQSQENFSPIWKCSKRVPKAVDAKFCTRNEKSTRNSLEIWLRDPLMNSWDRYCQHLTRGRPRLA